MEGTVKREDTVHPRDPSDRTHNHGRLRVASNQRYLEYDDGTPFFYLGDTAWQLFHRLNREESERYLADRAEKGFTVVQAVALAELGGLDVPNANGDLALIDRDPLQPNEPYFRHVDDVVHRAGELGLVVGMLPTWGSHWKRVGMEPPYLFTAENARAYGRFVGQRYADAPLIWILGGDRAIESEEERAIVEAMAAGLDEGDRGAHLMTYHPRGPGRSSDYFHHASWLDFNMIQSSHGAHDHDNGLFVDADYALQPTKPTLDGEPRYEHIPVGFYVEGANRHDRFAAYDVRQAAYWSLLAGACGFTYGNNNVWQMWAPGRAPAIGACVPWYEALDHPGAFQMDHVRRLFERYPFHKLVPDGASVVDGPRTGGAKVRASRARDSSFLLAYSPRGERFTIDKGVMNARQVRESWYDPRYGTQRPFHNTDNAGFQTYTPPTSGLGQDWILVLDDAEAGPALG
jgi:hypothetical protein